MTAPADEAPFYQVRLEEHFDPLISRGELRHLMIRVEARLENDDPEYRETFPAIGVGFECSPQGWDAMIASDRGASYINLMGPVLAEDPHFAPIRDRVEALLLDEFGARCENGTRTKEI